MARLRRALGAKPDELSLISGIYTVEGENRLLKGILWPPHGHHGICVSTCVCVYSHTHTLTQHWHTHTYNHTYIKSHIITIFLSSTHTHRHTVIKILKQNLPPACNYCHFLCPLLRERSFFSRNLWEFVAKFCTGSVLATATFPWAGEGPGSHTMEKQRDGRLP